MGGLGALENQHSEVLVQRESGENCSFWGEAVVIDCSAMFGSV